MDIEKIKNYNQKILAILGSLVIVLLLVWLIIEIFPGRSPQGLLSGEEITELNQKNLRKQIISYESPWLIDTLKSVYIVPVSIKTLRKAEKTTSSGNVLSEPASESYRSVKAEKGYYNRKSFEGDYANLILYCPVEEKTISLFNERIFLFSAFGHPKTTTS